MKPKKRTHTTVTGKVFHGTDAEFHLSAHMPYARLTLAGSSGNPRQLLLESHCGSGAGIRVSAMRPQRRSDAASSWTDLIYGPPSPTSRKA